MSDRKRWIRFVAYSLEIILLYALQDSPWLFPPIFGVRPILMIPAAVTIAMVEKETPAMSFGIFTGLLMDFSASAGLGFFASVLAVLCFVISRMSSTILRVNMMSAVVSGLWATVVAVFLGWLFRYVLKGYSSAGYVALHNYLPVCFYTLLLLPLIFYINRGIARTFRPEY
ncbi:rod shape-determining protein MreD [Scatolibacter rhodanostii]|uniref:rod shape-determining protein MreD n=1 Tax=Scatolibacter rhodanostii TaxID=2014781 RepID=UPI000C06A65C|nr:rod shape-determining protein MreD [Scatolibacter rhodanostii]